MAWVAVGTGVVSLGATAFKYFKGRQQDRQADRMRINDPGFKPNAELADNARMLGDRYSNYMLPGYSAAEANIRQGAASVFDRGVQGATSSSDVIDLASRSAYAEQQGLNQLADLSAQGKEGALMQYLRSKEAAGNDMTRINMLELDRYNQQMRERAALTQASMENQYSAINEGIAGLSTAASAVFTPTTTVDGSGNIVTGKSAWQTWLDKRNTRRDERKLLNNQEDFINSTWNRAW